MYKLRSGIYLVQGAHRYALYDTRTGKVYSLNKAAVEVLKGNSTNKSFLEQLHRLGLLEQAAPSEKYSLPMLPEAMEDSFKVNIGLEFVWFEVTSRCNERCIHCYASAGPIAKRRKGTGLSFNKWKRVILESAQLGATQCQFIGGEPFLYRGENGESIFDLIEVAREVGFSSVEVFTNGTLLNKTMLQRLKRLEVKLAVSLYSIRPEIHDTITRTPGSCQRTLKNLEFIKESEIPVRVEIIVLNQNADLVEETLLWLEERNIPHGAPDVVRPSGRGMNTSLYPEEKIFEKYGLIIEPSFYADIDFIKRSIRGNNCLAGKLVITEEGEVLPCIFSRDISLGNVLSSSLQAIINQRDVQRIWRNSKDNVIVCRDCEYRYVCHDCRALAFSVSPNQKEGQLKRYLTAPYPRCTYNPYTGEWGQGVWRIDERGEAHYSIIQGGVK